MYEGLLKVHSGLRWVALLFIILALVSALVRWRNNYGFGLKGKFLNLFTVISFHTQLLIGLILYFISDNVQFSSGMMKNSVARFYTLEHITMMILAVVLVTVGNSRVKKAHSDQAKNRRTLLFFGIALVIVLASIPWPFRNLGAGWY